MTSTATRGNSSPPTSAESTAPRRRSGRTWFPYLILLPAVILELLIHIVPMVTGFWMSFVELTKFFIRRWTEAPFAGLDNYRIAVDLETPIGQELLSSFLVTVAFTALVVGLTGPGRRRPSPCSVPSGAGASSAPCSWSPTPCRSTPR